MQVNPNGPQTDESGNLALTSPDSEAVALAAASDTDASKIQIPDWDYEAASQPINIAASSSPESVASYSAALTDIVNQHFVSTNIANVVNTDNPDPTQVGSVNPKSSRHSAMFLRCRFQALSPISKKVW